MAPESDVAYWDSASKYWKDIATVNPYWAWERFYRKSIPHEQLDILVVGVTNGAFLKLLKEFRPHAWVCGIDISFGMLTSAQSVEKKVVCCRGNALPFKNEKFDIVLSDYFLSVIREDALEDTVEEFGRVLKKDGLLIAKELRHRGHATLWAASTAAMGILCAAFAFVSPVLSVGFGVLCGVFFFAYNPVRHAMGRSAAAAKLVLHVFKFVRRRKRIPTAAEIGELYFLSEKYLHIFTDRDMDTLFSNSSFAVTVEKSCVSWNFSIVGVKQ